MRSVFACCARLWPAILSGLLICGCKEEPPPPHPHQEAVKRAEKVADQAAERARQTAEQAARQAEAARQEVAAVRQQAETARQEAEHQQRLREIDRMKYDAVTNEMQTAWSVWSIWLVLLAGLLVILAGWLAREIRLRKALGLVLLSVRRRKEAR